MSDHPADVGSIMSSSADSVDPTTPEDSEDADYTPDVNYQPRTKSTNAQTTPSVRLRLHEKVSCRGKARVKKSDPNFSRCLIQNLDPECSIQYAHCFLRMFKKDYAMLDSIEWHWGMQRYTLNLDTRYNIFPCGATMHIMHDKGFWTLLPEKPIVDIYYQTITFDSKGPLAPRAELPQVPSIPFVLSHQHKSEIIPTFKYSVFSLQDKHMKNIPILRQDNIPNSTKGLNPDDFTVHVHRYPNMPLVTSHLAPRFVILETSRKLSKLNDTTLFSNLLRQNPMVGEILHIYNAWTKPLSSEQIKDDPFNTPPPDPNPDWKSDRTRAQRPRPPKRPRSGQGSPTPQGGKRVQLGDGSGTKPTDEEKTTGFKGQGGQSLSGSTLWEHDRSVGDRKWNRELIRSWAERCELPVEGVM